ncbi:cation diffusion facilitator family transporter [Clostridium thermarum]|uniref:cation diffusion facilitator family transporter n=1 Tax=Clostridium thermarum TaxID=1716543 RepID=UPI0011206382|nr:cation diffusion facilitator family transporter [Clostridium thermarum]
MESYKLGTKVSVVTMIANIILSIFKLIAGIFGKSAAMTADAVHSVSDVFTTVVVIIGLKMSSKGEDKEHPYGHERLEAVCAKIISAALLLVGFTIGYKSAVNLYEGNVTTPRSIALWAAVVSIIVKEGMYWYTIITARKIRSIAMEGDAWHHRSDAFSSVGTFLGILGARYGYTFLDPVAGMIVSILIIKVGVDLYIRAVKELIDSSADKETLDKISNSVLSIDGVRDIKNLKTRIFGNRIYVDIEVFVDEGLSVREGHDIAEIVHSSVQNEINAVKHCMVHIEPFIGSSI